jgi:hypothetical protein
MRDPYLKERRLPEVIAAITAMAVYPFYKQSAAEWANRISGSEECADHWRMVFEEHPEFFRPAASSDDFSLVWRRQLPRGFDVRDLKEISPDYLLEESKRDPIGRRPLEPKEVTELIGAAIKLHDRALEQNKARTWWIPLASAALSFVGALLGGLLGK